MSTITTAAPTVGQQRLVRRARFTGDFINPGALVVVEKAVAPFLPINLYDLGTTGLMDYVAGRSPYYPHEPLTGKPPREWRLKQACIVIESRAGVDTGARERFIAAANHRISDSDSTSPSH